MKLHSAAFRYLSVSLDRIKIVLPCRRDEPITSYTTMALVLLVACVPEISELSHPTRVRMRRRLMLQLTRQKDSIVPTIHHPDPPLVLRAHVAFDPERH